MTTTLPILQSLEQAFRVHVCNRCPRRSDVVSPEGSFVRGCEADCEQFHALPALQLTAARLDPMVASVPDALRRLMQTSGGKVKWQRRRRNKVIQLIQQSIRAR
jgi:hypothetical protein